MNNEMNDAENLKKAVYFAKAAAGISAGLYGGPVASQNSQSLTKSPIWSAVEVLEQLVSELHGRIGELDMRLEPICSPAPDKLAPSTPNISASSPLAIRILDLAKSLEVANRKISRLQEVIDL